MKSSRVKQQHGFTIIQMVITIAIVAVVSTFGVIGIRSARAEFRLQSSARLFASYVEKARADSVRRHAASGAEASVETFGAGTSNYTITMDFGTGTVETRTFQLDPGVDFLTDALKVTFDWRGRLLTPCAVTKSCVFQVRSVSLSKSIPVDVSGSGDITVDAQHFPDGLIPEVEIAEVGSGDVDPDPVGTPAIEGTPTPDPVDGGGGGIDPIDPTPTPTPVPTATPNGNGNGNGNGSGGNNGNGNGNGNPTPTPTPVPTATPTPGSSPSPSPIVQCISALSPSTITISQSDSAHKTGTATFSITNGSGVRLISATQEGNGNSMVLALSLVRMEGSGSTQISVTSKNGAGNRGTFSVKVAADPVCGSSQTLTVIVNN
jgi:type II secretory pathway pseudopilin PulG